jgi:general secretion pathway protein E
VNIAEPILVIAPEVLQAARAEAARSERKLIEVLEERLSCSPAELVERLSAAMRLPAATLDELCAGEPVFEVVPYAEAVRRGCVAIRASGEIIIVLSDPYDIDFQDWVENRPGAPYRYKLAHRLDIAAYLSQQEEQMRALDGVAEGLGEGSGSRERAEEISFETISETDSTVVRLVNSTLYDALRAGASDIHVESTPSGLSIKYRIDGVLTPARSVPGTELVEQVVSRIKVMSELDIAERRVPQDGRFKARRGGREIDFRVSVMPSVFGEDAVLRVLDKQTLSDQLHGLTLDQLGYNPGLIRQLRQLSSEPYGMLLVTGPTGSGKTTSLRHDPDRIMVGEIRDPETAEIAVQSALTGHLVYTTVHANNVFDVLGRFAHMGVDTYNFVSALNGVLAQRLVRQVCPECAVEQREDDALLTESGIELKDRGQYRFVRGRGCGHCRGTGYKGRKAIGELLVMNDDLRERIVAREPIRKLKEAARAGGTVPLREAALELVKAGETTLEEINRVTFVS